MKNTNSTQNSFFENFKNHFQEAMGKVDWNGPTIMNHDNIVSESVSTRSKEQSTDAAFMTAMVGMLGGLAMSIAVKEGIVDYEKQPELTDHQAVATSTMHAREESTPAHWELPFHPVLPFLGFTLVAPVVAGVVGRLALPTGITLQCAGNALTHARRRRDERNFGI